MTAQHFSIMVILHCRMLIISDLAQNLSAAYCQQMILEFPQVYTQSNISEMRKHNIADLQSCRKLISAPLSAATKNSFQTIKRQRNQKIRAQHFGLIVITLMISSLAGN